MSNDPTVKFSGYIDSVVNVAALRNYCTDKLATGATIIVDGHDFIGDANGGIYVLDTASTATDDGLHVVTPASGGGRWLLAAGAGNDAATVLYKAGLINAPTAEAFDGYLLAQGAAAVAAATAQAQAAQTSATASATSATAAASSAISSQASATASASSAASAATSAGQAQIATATARAYPTSAATVVPTGVTGTTALVGGSGGANGTFALSITGGGGSNASGTFTVVGGTVTSITITGGGYGYTSAPTLSFAASSGLTGASATATIGTLVQSGSYYWAQSSDGLSLNLYQNASGTPTLASPAVSIPTNAALTSAVSTASGATMVVPDIVDTRLPVTKNLFDPARTTPGYITTAGIVSTNTVHISSDFIPVTPGMVFTPNVPLVGNTGANGRICFYDASKTLVSSLGYSSSADFPAGSPITVPSTTTIRFMRVSVVLATAKPAQIMLVRGSTLPTQFVAFDLADRLTVAYEAMGLIRMFGAQYQNLHDANDVVDGLFNNVGTLTPTADYWTTRYMPVRQGDSIVFSHTDDFNSAYGMPWYDKDKNLLTVTPCPIVAGTLYPVPAGASFVRRSMRKKVSSGAGTVSRVALAELEVYAASSLPAKSHTAEKMDRASALDLIATAGYASRKMSTNLLDITKVTTGSLYQLARNGTFEPTLVTFTGGCFGHLIPCSPDIPVTANDYKFNGSYPIILFYDANQNFMSGVWGGFVGGLYQPLSSDNTTLDPNVTPAPLYPPRGARYVRFQGFSADLSGPAYNGFGSFPTGGAVADPAAAVAGLKRWSGKRWIAAGDSITAQAGGYGQFWMPQTAAYLGVTLTNNGVSGHTMAQVLTDPQFTQTNIQANDLATVAMGTNDWGLNTPLGTSTDPKTASTFAGSIKNIIETVLGWNPDIRLAFRTPTQRLDSPSARSTTNTLLDYANMIRTICQDQYGVPVYDAYRLSGWNAVTIPILAADGVLHPNADGGAHLWPTWGRFLESL